ncbi:MAG: TonB-dependent receptor [Cyclobacteriaceae bacterium]|nr:TonB-dependent receptor [Cyclobacteriaceae bacterium]
MSILARYLTIITLVFCFVQVKGQQGLKVPIERTAGGQPLLTLLQNLEENYAIQFHFLPEWLKPFRVAEISASQSLEEVLISTLSGSDISFISLYPNSIVFIKDPEYARMRNQLLTQARANRARISKTIIGSPGQASTQSVTISGIVMADKTQEPLPGVTVRLGESIGVTTNATGKYELRLMPGIHGLSFSYLDYETQVIDLEVYSDGELNVTLEKAPHMLDEVVVTDKSIAEVTTSRIGQIQLTMREMKRAPAFMGEVDLIKQVQTLPGVTTVGEAAAGFNVRGGSVDQNLVLFDDMPVFNSSHAFGFLSSFNHEVVRDVSFYRGGIPAEYGGRNASVLDIQSRDGNFEKWAGSAGIGLVTSNVAAHGPLKKDKTSLLGSFRSTYSNWLVNSIRTDYIDLRNSSVKFYDGTLKLSHKFSEKTMLAVSGYSSHDAFSLSGDTTYQWNNFVLASRINHRFSESLNAEFQAGFSRYGYEVFNVPAETASRLSFRINTVRISSDFQYQKQAHTFRTGWQALFYSIQPGALRPESAISNARSFKLDNQFSVENAFYLSDTWNLGNHWHVESGIRVPLFLSFGKQDVYHYRADAPRETENITDTTYYGSGEIVRAYAGVEPRLSVRWQRSEKASVKFGYHRINQFLHLITNSTSVTPVDIWQPSSYYFKPQRADQLSVGYYRDMKAKHYNFFVEAFYKNIANVLDFKDGAQLVLNPQLETELLQGRGYAYGIESYLSKNSGRLTGTINYTYSRSFRIIHGRFNTESINRGNKYPSNFDQPHIANLSWKYSLSRRHFFTGNFTYHTGRPVTIPIAAFEFEGSPVAYFSGRNQYRIPDYHRLDLALVFEGNHKRTQRWKGTWVFSVYNVYARKNPYTVFFKNDGSGVPVPYQLSIIGTAFPAISYTIRFE